VIGPGRAGQGRNANLPSVVPASIRASTAGPSARGRDGRAARPVHPGGDGVPVAGQAVDALLQLGQLVGHLLHQVRARRPWQQVGRSVEVGQDVADDPQGQPTVDHRLDLPGLLHGVILVDAVPVAAATGPQQTFVLVMAQRAHAHTDP
jgi:hypothetical protein